MKTYLISYDLVNKKILDKYLKLIKAIKTYNYWAKPLESLWLIKTNDSSMQITVYLKKFIDQTDRLLVIEVTDDWTCFNMDLNVVKWMKAEIN